MTKFSHFPRFGTVLLLLGASIALSGCATTASERKPSGNALKDLAIWAGFATTTEEPADFVKASRTSDLSYMPVGVTPAGPQKNARKLTPEELKALEDELEAARTRNEAAGGQKP